MEHTTIALTLLMLGILLLVSAIAPINQICIKDSSIDWGVLRYLIFFFIIGYLGVTYYFFHLQTVGPLELIVSSIMFSGGIFVYLVTRLALKSLLKLEKLALSEQENALHDGLTKLPNRRFLMERLAYFIDQKKPFKLFIIDLNQFKQINDALGHYYGDMLLIHISNHVQQAIPSFAQLFRLGGDEFAIISTSISQANTGKVITSLHSCFEPPYEIDNFELSTSASVGIASFPDSSPDIENLLQCADLAMYDCKRNSKSYVEYNSSMRTNAAEKMMINARLKEALEQDKFELWYQPIINLVDQSVHGVEALIRLPLSKGEFINPDIFIKIAEQSSLITKITSWVIKRVVLDIESFKSHGLEDIEIHINMSVKDLQDDHIVPKIQQAFLEGEYQKSKLTLEITESALMTDIGKVKQTMHQLSSEQLNFSVDDFGTGFSSLALIRDLPVGQIKIDRSFICNMLHSPADLAIVKSTVLLAKNLGCSVVAEGVENKESEVLLKELECDFVQGYYYSKPLKLNDFVDYMSIKNKNVKCFHKSHKSQ